MKRSLTFILLAVFMVALMGGCYEREIFLNDSDKKIVTDILSKVECSTETEEFDGGIWLQAYSGDKIKWNITV